MLAAREREEPAETELGLELRARLRLIEVCADGVQICALPDGHETSMEEPHWGRNSEGQPIAWVGSAPDDW